MKTTKERRIILILSLIVPLLYLSMYLPVWNGKELSLANAGAFPIILFVFQCICLLIAILHLLVANFRNSENGLLSSVFSFCFASSLVLTCFFGLFFILELFGVTWFPAQR